MDWKMIAGSTLAAGLVALTCIEEHKLENPTRNVVTGQVVRERFWREPGFGPIYRIELKTSERTQPYVSRVVIGNERELRLLDEKINVGDNVTVADNYAAYTLDLQKVVLPNDVQKNDAQKPYSPSGPFGK